MNAIATAHRTHAGRLFTSWPTPTALHVGTRLGAACGERRQITAVRLSNTIHLPLATIDAGRSSAAGLSAQGVSSARIEMESVMRFPNGKAATRRRRPGECWNLWRVVGVDRTTRKDVAIGLLVTDRERCPNLIAYVKGTDGRSLRRALAIRRRPSRAATALDLRGFNEGERFPAFLKGMLLLPINTLGRVITNDDTFAGGMFMHTSSLIVKTGKVEHWFGFSLGTHDGVRMWNEESGAPVKPPAPELAGEGSEKKSHAAAA